MSGKTVRNALIAQLQANTVLAAEFGATNIRKGIETQFDINTNTKGLRIATELSRQANADMTGGKINAMYGFSVVAYFYETDSGLVDDRMSEYDEWIREAIESDFSLGINVQKMEIGQTTYRTHQRIKNIYLAIIPLLCLVRELRGNR